MRKVFFCMAGFFLSFPICKSTEIKTDVEKFQLQIKEEVTIKEESKTKIKNSEFLKKLGFLESTNNYKAFNGKFMGKYQFGPLTLKDIGYDIHPDTFKINPNVFPPELQEEAIIKLLKRNKKILNKIINKYEGKTVNGIYISKAGLLAAAHLGGAGSVIKFIKTNGDDDFKDGNDTPISKYLQIFSNVKINI